MKDSVFHSSSTNYPYKGVSSSVILFQPKRRLLISAHETFST
ncbi:hypothetical protein T03_5754 [Trichinella britovi]|uniref:Uncharacterized protein n=1 Tax=Trichinella britovi TaxID=45882 RepID=A0A0V0YUW5_TRIBR|nr:hypothetical protein T03_5754 [Trichinella britovi]